MPTQKEKDRRVQAAEKRIADADERITRAKATLTKAQADRTKAERDLEWLQGMPVDEEEDSAQDTIFSLTESEDEHDG